MSAVEELARIQLAELKAQEWVAEQTWKSQERLLKAYNKLTWWGKFKHNLGFNPL